MKYFSGLILLIAFAAHGQSRYKVSYGDLLKYEGTYQYGDGGQLQIAANPKDTLLYAIIGESRYRLRPSAKDEFLNNGNQQIHFFFKGDRLDGYTVADATPDKFYKLLDRKITFQKRAWIPRADGAQRWHYSVPAPRNDGLETGPVAGSGLDSALLHNLVDRIVDGTYNDVHSVLIVKDDKLIFEEYFYEYSENRLHQLRSASKSFSSALVGIALDKGLIKGRQEKVLPFFPDYSLDQGDPRKKLITIENMLTQQSGFDCDDDESSSTGNEVKIYPTHDWVKTVLDLPMVDAPGHAAHYCSGNIFVLNQIVQKVSGKSLHAFAKENLFDKIGVERFDWDFVPDETHQDSYSQISLRPRDMVKFGLLYLHHGKWNHEQVISREYVDASLTRHSTLRGLGYGYLWWCEDLTVNGKTFRGIAAKGNGGQRIFLWPDQNMMAVVTAGNYNTQSPSNRLLMECVLGGLRK